VQKLWIQKNVKQGIHMHTSCAVVILGHGTRRKAASQGFFALVDRIGRRMWPVRVVPACFSCGQPTLYKQAAQLAAENVSRIIIFPYFLLSGKHIAEELPEVVQELREHFPDIRFDLLETMEDEPLLEAIVVTRLQGDVWSTGRVGADEIKNDQIIAGHFATTGNPAALYPFFRAMALATGDLALAAAIRICGRADLAYGEPHSSALPVLCDSTALTAGVEAMGRKAVCIPEPSQSKAFLEKNLSGAIVALGSSSLLLVQILDLVQEGLTPPCLLVALPPGFTDAPLAKERLAGHEDIVYISNAGTGGGISCVLAMIQALESLTSQRNQPDR
jgi:precorrin isomerase